MELVKIAKIAERLGTNPEELLQLFFGIGIMVMNQTLEYLDQELKSKLKELFPSTFEKMKEEDYKELLAILKNFINK